VYMLPFYARIADDRLSADNELDTVRNIPNEINSINFGLNG
jgi:hypothetical protein